ncbi:putative toxin-antitoxin system toxin component, PIN family [Rubrobacter taiwanensis]|uniref:Putative toxin-antitoxin system toxin component, PIN family n=1 Tax=Rubrobacter taiwanensis TaxID=185139 RepID=A0A4R1BQD9_9ACTN|nr:MULTISPECIES: putative toxin-antitoxin system toxin component, PIN family [Rubrobacter]MCA3748198.1 putative toxin-antitoxin system toxin component, PIN family [Rubrobacter sp.]TCJ19476.1 putative toxin-antitoxin system toxin component, PIN family [Rubrobacter taiwanensis]
MSGPLVVLDTDAVVTALIGDEGASSYRILRAVGAGDIRVALSDAFLVELVRTVRNRYRQGLILNAARAFEVALDLGLQGELRRPPGWEWPSVPDPEDRWIPDLAYDAGADFIVTWDRHLLDAELPFSAEVVTPAQLLQRLSAPAP